MIKEKDFLQHVNSHASIDCRVKFWFWVNYSFNIQWVDDALHKKMECWAICLSNLIASYFTDEGRSGRDQRELRGRPLLRGQRQHSGHAHQQLDRQPCWEAVLDSASATLQNDASVFFLFVFVCFPAWARFDLLILKQKFYTSLIWGIRWGKTGLHSICLIHHGSHEPAL